jgi:hypothetical protein
MLTDDEDRQLKQELMMADLQLRRKQVGWETPRNITIVAGAVAALSAAVGGVFGFKLAQTAPPPPIIIQLPTPAAK